MSPLPPQPPIAERVVTRLLLARFRLAALLPRRRDRDERSGPPGWSESSLDERFRDDPTGML